LKRARARRIVTATLLASVAIAAAPFLPARVAARDRRPNIVLILTDDQSFDSIPHDPAVMPHLQGMLQDRSGHWVRFRNAFVQTPLCCPSRSTILTGLYSHDTGVRTNYEGADLDESSTIATWLHDAGYHTGLIGKYVNGYPFGRPYVPFGWDRWLGKRQGAQPTAYYGYVLEDQGFPVFHGFAPGDYSTDVFTSAAEDFIRTAPEDRPFFLEVAPTAPHRPWVAAPGDAGTDAGMSISEPPSLGEEDVSDKPAWVRALPSFDAERRLQVHEIHRRSFEALLAVDRLVAGVMSALREKGVLDDTVVFFLTDNGFSFGEHRWLGKTCPYEECIRTPLLIRYPRSSARTDDHLVSTVDLAPTIADLAGVTPDAPFDGRSVVPLLGGSWTGPWRRGVFLEYAGDSHVPGWTAIRTADFLYIEYATGERELYDLTGRIGEPDPYELHDRVSDPAYRSVVRVLAARLAALRSG
jgi:arylsulfatase A-like enzyme